MRFIPGATNAWHSHLKEEHIGKVFCIHPMTRKINTHVAGTEGSGVERTRSCAALQQMLYPPLINSTARTLVLGRCVREDDMIQAGRGAKDFACLCLAGVYVGYYSERRGACCREVSNGSGGLRCWSWRPCGRGLAELDERRGEWNKVKYVVNLNLNSKSVPVRL